MKVYEHLPTLTNRTPNNPPTAPRTTPRQLKTVNQDSTEFLFRSSLGFPPFDEGQKSKLHGESKQFTFSLLLRVFQFTFSFFGLFLVYFWFNFGLILRVFQFTFSVYFFHFQFTFPVYFYFRFNFSLLLGEFIFLLVS